MSVDLLQDKIRKLKNPSVVDFQVSSEQLPPHILEQAESYEAAYERFCMELLLGLKDVVPAVRFSFNHFALMGDSGLSVLKRVLAYAKEQGFYVLLDVPEALSLQQAEIGAKVFFAEEKGWCFDGLILCAYIGSDGLKPYTAMLEKQGKALFAVVRTANRTAPELQDLLTGSRLVHLAAADIVSRLAQPYMGRCGYSHVGAVAGASSAHSLHTLRTKYNRLFLLLDGYDYANSNAKNCSEAFDQLGHGAAACAGTSVTAAYLAEEADSREYVACAVRAAERMRRNLTRYITVL